MNEEVKRAHAELLVLSDKNVQLEDDLADLQQDVESLHSKFQELEEKMQTKSNIPARQQQPHEADHSAYDTLSARRVKKRARTSAQPTPSPEKDEECCPVIFERGAQAGQVCDENIHSPLPLVCCGKASCPWVTYLGKKVCRQPWRNQQSHATKSQKQT